MNKDYKSINNLWKDSEGYRYFGTLKLSSKIKYDGDDFIPLWEWINQLQQENKILKENAEHNDKVVDKVNWENQLLKKENKQLKEDIKNIIRILNKNCDESFAEGIDVDPEDLYMAELEQRAMDCELMEMQQKEFINYLEDKIYSIEPKGTSINYNCEYDSEEDYVMAMQEQSRLNTLKEILQKYKEIIGDDK